MQNNTRMHPGRDLLSSMCTNSIKSTLQCLPAGTPPPLGLQRNSLQTQSKLTTHPYPPPSPTPPGVPSGRIGPAGRTAARRRRRPGAGAPSGAGPWPPR